jgi:hypothetical protein
MGQKNVNTFGRLTRLTGMRRVVVSALILFCMTGPGNHVSYGQNRSGYIETVGIGVQDPSITNETQRRATSRDAALTQAQAKMLSLLQSRSSGGAADQEKLKAGILQGAYVVKTEWTRDGTCRLTLRLKK